MVEHFSDTSAAVKHYRAELGTAKVDSLLADTASRHFLSSLGVVEIHSVFARLVRTGVITPAEFHRLRGLLLSDIASGLWRVVQVTAADFQEARSGCWCSTVSARACGPWTPSSSRWRSTCMLSPP
jgi:hypothetical protein